jgi:hypothetical protein
MRRFMVQFQLAGSDQVLTRPKVSFTEALTLADSPLVVSIFLFPAAE